MNELKITLEDVNLITLWGTNNENFDLIKESFPKLKIIARGDEVKAMGTQEDLGVFQKLMDQLISFVRRRHSLTALQLENLLNTMQTRGNTKKNSDHLADKEPGGEEEMPIVYGPNGRIIRARTPNQKRMVESLEQNDVLFAIGPAGTGKTYTAVALAVRALRNKEVKRIILTRPAVEAGENLGFLPGDLKEKVDPYLRPLYDALDDMIPATKLKYLLENGTIEVAPLAFMRGRTLDHCFVILDEAQNTTDMQLKMFLTRMGPDAKFIINGDLTQVDLPKKIKSGLSTAVRLLEHIKGIGVVKLSGRDVVRHKLVRRILEAYGDFEGTDSELKSSN